MPVRVRIGDLAEGEIYPVPELNAVLVKLGGEVHAFVDQCPHANCNFSLNGAVEGDTLVCICHYGRFDIRTGRSLTPELTGEPLRRIGVRIEGDEAVLEQ